MRRAAALCALLCVVLVGPGWPALASWLTLGEGQLLRSSSRALAAGEAAARCPGACPRFPAACQAWRDRVFAPWRQAVAEPQRVLVLDTANGGLGESTAFDVSALTWALQHSAGVALSERNFKAAFWCGLDNFLLGAVPPGGELHPIWGDKNPRAVWVPAGAAAPDPVPDVRIVGKKRAALLEDPEGSACLLQAYTCPSAALAQRIESVQARLPPRYIALHFRSAQIKYEREFLVATAGPIPPLKSRRWQRHAKHVDDVLRTRCAQLRRCADAQNKPKHCNQTYVFPADTFWGTSLCSNSAPDAPITQLFGAAARWNVSFPFFFTTDNQGISDYAKEHMGEWLVQSEGDPYHYPSTEEHRARKNKTAVANDFLGDQGYASQARTFVDFSLFSTSVATIGVFPSDFSIMPTLLGGGDYRAIRLGRDRKEHPEWSVDAPIPGAG